MAGLERIAPTNTRSSEGSAGWKRFLRFDIPYAGRRHAIVMSVEKGSRITRHFKNLPTAVQKVVDASEFKSSMVQPFTLILEKVPIMYAFGCLKCGLHPFEEDLSEREIVAHVRACDGQLCMVPAHALSSSADNTEKIKRLEDAGVLGNGYYQPLGTARYFCVGTEIEERRRPARVGPAYEPDEPEPKRQRPMRAVRIQREEALNALDEEEPEAEEWDDSFGEKLPPLVVVRSYEPHERAARAARRLESVPAPLSAYAPRVREPQSPPSPPKRAAPRATPAAPTPKPKSWSAGCDPRLSMAPIRRRSDAEPEPEPKPKPTPTPSEKPAEEKSLGEISDFLEAFLNK